MIQVNVECPLCRTSLMDSECQIDGKDSIKVRIEFDGKRGFLWLNSLSGSYNIESEHDIPVGTLARFFCHHCQAEFKTTWTCEACSAPMVAMNFSEGGGDQICSRRGCKKHIIEFEDWDQELRAFYNRYSPF